MRRCTALAPPPPPGAPGMAAALDAARVLLEGAPMRRLVSELTGESCDGETVVQPTLFRQGDFLSLHNDAGSHRRVAFALHLAEWAEGAGGELAFTCPADGGGARMVPPRFNALTLFVAHGPASMHMVMPVVNATAGRFALSGWFTQRQAARSDDRFTSQSLY